MAMKRFLLAGACGLALLASPGALAQSRNQTPAARRTSAQTPAQPPATAQKPKPADDDATTPAPDDSNDGQAAGEGEKQAPIPFAGGELTITQQEEYGEKVLSFDGKEIAHNYQVIFDRIANVGGTDVAMVDVGNGGNACGPAKVLIWKPEGGDIRTETVGKDCGAPQASVSDDRIVFLPYVLPGATALVETWSPDGGLATAGELSFAPDPGTGWNDLDPSKLTSMIDALRNAAVYRASRKLLGERMEEVVTGLSVSGAPETTKMGLVFGNGCTPHACGVADSFMAVDTRNKAVYFAHQGEKGIDAWPAPKRWPDAIRGLMTDALRPPN
jgi:hypothetical protein